MQAQVSHLLMSKALAPRIRGRGCQRSDHYFCSHRVGQANTPVGTYATNRALTWGSVDIWVNGTPYTLVNCPLTHTRNMFLPCYTMTYTVTLSSPQGTQGRQVLSCCCVLPLPSASQPFSPADQKSNLQSNMANRESAESSIDVEMQKGGHVLALPPAPKDEWVRGDPGEASRRCHLVCALFTYRYF